MTDRAPPPSSLSIPWAGVLFDLDGTLADTVPLILRCYRHTMETHLGEALPDERWLATIGIPLAVQLEEFARSPAEATAMRETYMAFQRTVYDSMVCAFDGARDVLGELGSRGARLGVVTSKGREMALRTLESCGVSELVEVLVTPEDVARGKPDPEPVLLALERLGLADRGHEVVFVGDSPFDLRAGRAAGVRTAAALWGPFSRSALEPESPDWYLERLDEVLELRESGGGRPGRLRVDGGARPGGGSSSKSR